jgi:hypothetical protein
LGRIDTDEEVGRIGGVFLSLGLELHCEAGFGRRGGNEGFELSERDLEGPNIWSLELQRVRTVWQEAGV